MDNMVYKEILQIQLIIILDKYNFLLSNFMFKTKKQIIKIGILFVIAGNLIFPLKKALFSY